MNVSAKPNSGPVAVADRAPYVPGGGGSVEERFLEAAMSGENCFLTGMAGTGKSFTLRRFIELKSSISIRFIGEAAGIDVVAPTGVAAINVGGSTLHRFCGIGLGPSEGEDWDSFWEASLKKKMASGWRDGPAWRIRQCKTIIIDEISMLNGSLLDFVDWLFRRVRQQESLPFGGVQIIGVGDFLQLPPVRTSESKPYDWAFNSKAWQEAQFRCFNLTSVRRQDEPQFVNALSDFRLGRCTGRTAELLQARVKPFIAAHIPRLCTHNVQVDKWNSAQLESLDAAGVTLEAQRSGNFEQLNFLTRNLVTPAMLVLKVGAVVMCTINRDDYFNGLVGIVEEITPDRVILRTVDGGRQIEVEPFTWRFDYKDPASATFTQFPLRLAYAMTIHKSQGLTLDAAHVDIRAAREPGQAYVALSRVRKLEGLTLKGYPTGLFISNQAKEFYSKL